MTHVYMGTFSVTSGIVDRMVYAINGAGTIGYSNKKDKTELPPVSKGRQNIFFFTMRKMILC